ncbi:MAG: hypothetical protein WDO12_11085 [Pseudomonadota bacterium]
MIIARPTATEERWLLLADRYPALRAAVLKSGHCGGWKTSTWLSRLGGVVLALLGVGLLAAVLSPFHSPWIVGGVILLAVAEWLVAQRRVYRSGVEEVLYACGALGIVVQLLAWSDGNNEAAGAALLATAVLLAGWRLLNPVLTTLALAGFSLAIALVHASLFGGQMLNLRGAALFCAALALLALVAGARQWRRPAHDFMCDGLLIVMPWLCCAWLMAYSWDRSRDFVALTAAAGVGALWFATGVQRRSHALLIGAMGCAFAAALSLHRLLRWPLYWYLIAAGAVLLVVAIVIERRLRGRTAGITADAIDAMDGLDLLQFAGAAHLAPVAGHAPEAAAQGQGGEFGGGGASGRF